ncbi:MAG TPA: thioredoxin domain-containing protein [Terriglobales bacterium]|nr:thioredoxin domain-containing protein [Terriglobales bacterium]
MYSILKYLTVAICCAAMSLEAQSPAAANPVPASPTAASSASSSTTSINDPVLKQRIEQNLRARFRIPSQVTMEIGERTPSEFTGYDQVTVILVNQGHKSPNTFLLSKDGKTLAQINRIDLTKDPFALDNRPVRGAQDAKVKVIVYDDFECPYCARGYQMLFNDILPEYKDKILITYKDFPLYEIHPWAIHAAVDANCLGAQSNDAYWAFSDYVHANQGQINGEKRSTQDQFAALDASALDYGKKNNLDTGRLDACIKAQDETTVRDSLKYGEESLGVEATPTLFVNGTKLDGAVPADDMRKILNAALEKAGVPLPAAELKTEPGKDAKGNSPEAQTAPNSTAGTTNGQKQDAGKADDPKPATGADPKK